MIRVNEIKTPLEGTYDDVLAGAAKALRISKRKILSLEIVRKSLDSRKKENLFFVHSVDVTVDGDEKEILAKSDNDVKIKYPHDKYKYIVTGKTGIAYFNYGFTVDLIVSTLIIYLFFYYFIIKIEFRFLYLKFRTIRSL